MGRFFRDIVADGIFVYFLNSVFSFLDSLWWMLGGAKRELSTEVVNLV